MFDNNQFYIENIVFSIQITPDFTEKSVKSIPNNYLLRWSFDENPLNIIRHYFIKLPNSRIIVDTKIYNLYKMDMHEDFPDRILCLEATEETKSWNILSIVLDFLNAGHFTKTDTLIVVGGGIIGDLSGFAAACFRRGIPWVYIPTTLLSMADSCIGGKTAINFRSAKNQIGVFYSPHEVIINPNFLKTLNYRDILSGLGEILKISVLAGPQFLHIFEEQLNTFDSGINFKKLSEMVFLALEVKKQIIEYDQFEVSVRKVLNYGHTIGHIIESLSGFQISHGQAVSFGIMFANFLSLKSKMLSTENFENINRIAIKLIDNQSITLLKEIAADAHTRIAPFLQKDKKSSGSLVTFALISEPGNTVFKAFNMESIESHFKDFCSYFSERF